MNSVAGTKDYSPTRGQADERGIAEFSDTLDLRSAFMVVWRGKWVVAICLLIAYAIGYLSVSQITPTYRSEAFVMFDTQQTNVVDLQSVLSEQGVDRERLEDEMMVLSSSALLSRVVDDLNLYQDPEFNRRLLPPETSVLKRVIDYTNVREIGWNILRDLDLVEGELKQPVAESAEDRLPRESDGPAIVRRLKSQLDLAPVGRSRVLRIAFVAEDPESAADIANTIANQYIVDQLEAKLEATRAATSWLSERVEELRIRVQAAEEAVQSARADFTKERGQGLEITQQQLGALNKALAEARAERTRAETRFDRLTLAIQSGQVLGRDFEFREDQVIQSLRNELSRRETAFNLLAASVSVSNPRIVQAEKELELLRQETDARIMREAEQIVAGAKNRLDAAIQQEQALLEQVQALEATSLVQAEDELRLRQLEREAQASRVLYENFLGRLQETDAQQDLQVADARVLTAAEPPNSPQQHKRKRTMFLSLVSGGVAGIGLVVLINMLNNTFRSPPQLEAMSGYTVLGTIPKIKARSRRAVLQHLTDQPSSSMAESVRNLRTSILMSDIDRPPQVVMFTSTVPREGKTTTSMLVALTSHQMGKSVLVIDCDMRLPAVSRMLKDPGTGPGLMSVLMGESSVVDAISTDPETGLDFLFAKSSEIEGAANAADLLSSRKFLHLLEALKSSYDLIVLDAPPALVVTDARILAKSVDAVVYMVHWDKTPRGAVLEGLRQLETVDAPIRGVAMCFINETKASKYTYDGYIYYKGQYQDYYTS